MFISNFVFASYGGLRTKHIDEDEQRGGRSNNMCIYERSDGEEWEGKLRCAGVTRWTVIELTEEHFEESFLEFLSSHLTSILVKNRFSNIN